MDTSVHGDDYLTNEVGLINLGHVNHIEMSQDFKINDDNRRHGNGNRRV